MKVEVGMMKSNDLDKYVSRLNEIMENSPPKLSKSENLKVSQKLKARIEKISLENNKVKKKIKKMVTLRYWKIKMEVKYISQLKIDTENATVDYINIDSTRVIQIYKNGDYTLFWADEQYNYEINSDSHLDILLDLAEEFIKKYILSVPLLDYLIVIYYR